MKLLSNPKLLSQDYNCITTEEFWGNDYDCAVYGSLDKKNLIYVTIDDDLQRQGYVGLTDTGKEIAKKLQKDTWVCYLYQKGNDLVSTGIYEIDRPKALKCPTRNSVGCWTEKHHCIYYKTL
jgi:hypothetical protein